MELEGIETGGDTLPIEGESISAEAIDTQIGNTLKRLQQLINESRLDPSAPTVPSDILLQKPKLVPKQQMILE